MHVHFEQNTSTRTDTNILCLSWMGKVPDGLPDEAHSWKLNRAQYYMEGWLASGNAKGVVGVTFTTSHCQKYNAPPRSNFNLRGHRSEVVLVRWNEPYQKLATCDNRGVIFVWIKHEGRWSIELINDRNSQVTDFAWSHDGRMALICYRDGFVLVGSVAGQRYWSSMLNLDNISITCGVWSPDDRQVMFGTTDGQLIVMSSTGAMVCQVNVFENKEISALAWSCEKFNMEEGELMEDCKKNAEGDCDKCLTLAVCFKCGDIYLMSNYDDPCPRVITSSLIGLRMDWSNCGEYLAVGGFTRMPNLLCHNVLQFYSKEGKLIHSVKVPSQGKPLSALIWGHNDKRLFVAAGCHLYVAWVHKAVAPMQLLAKRVIQQLVRHERLVARLTLPTCLKQGVQELFSPTIKSYTPDPFKLREFVTSTPPGNERLYCTMIRHGDETSGGHYTLYLEYLGGLVPLLKGKRASKLRPDFVIYDPKIRSSSRECGNQNGGVGMLDGSTSSESEEDISAEGCGSPRMQRKRRQKTFRAEKVDRSITFRTLEELLYNDNLPESNRLVEVTSNIWGTKFQLVGLTSLLPDFLGQVVYKTSLLHLQPRQMTITLTELGTSPQPLSRDPNFTPAGASEDEDSLSASDIEDEQVINLSGNAVGTESKGQVSVDVQPPAEQEVALTPNGHVVADGPVPPVLSNCASRSGSLRAAPFSPVRTCLSQEPVPDITMCKDSGNGGLMGQGARPKVIQVHGSSRCGSSFPRGDKKSPKSPSSQTVSLSSNSKSPSPAAKTPSPNMKTPSPLAKTPVALSKIPGEMFLAHRPSVLAQEGAEAVAGGEAGVEEGPRWADPASEAIKYMDEEVVDSNELAFESNLVADCSPTAPTSLDLQRRLYLAQQGSVDSEGPGQKSNTSPTSAAIHQPSGPSLPGGESSMAHNGVRHRGSVGSVETDLNLVAETLLREASHLGGSTEIEVLQSASLPASPVHRLNNKDSPTRKLREEVLRGKCRHLSPIFKRKGKHCRGVDSSDEDILVAIENYKHGRAFKDLESFQKSQLKQKLRDSRGIYWGRTFRMHNKAPLWNENSQVYQLDFGGRVTQESAKNFQIEFRNKQVMQFGRIDSNAYTLDFQYPFTAIQAFAVALANVTQRLK